MLFPNVTKTIEDYEKIYPERNLPEGAEVCRFAPSPTGFLHIGGLYTAFRAERIAHQTNGVFLLRIEDTDQKREVENGVELLIQDLINFDYKIDAITHSIRIEGSKLGINNIFDASLVVNLIDSLYKDKTDAVFFNIAVALNVVNNNVKYKNKFMFRKDLPYVLDHYKISTIKNKKLIEDFNIFLKNNNKEIIDLKKKNGIIY